MLGTHAPVLNQIKAVKLNKSHALIIAVILFIVIGAGVWVGYQNGLLSQWLPQSTTVTAASGDIVLVQAQPEDLAAADASEQTAMPANAGAGADAAASASDVGGEAVAVATPVAALESAALEQVVISGVAGVGGASLWDDSGALIATLDSAAAIKITAISANRAWLFVQTAAGEGWTPTADVIAYGLGSLQTALLPGVLTTAGAQTADEQVTAAADATLLIVAETVESAQPAAAVSLAATVAADGSNVNIRSAAGTDAAIIAKAADGALYTAIGRNEAGDWLLLQLSDTGGDTGWAAAAYIELSGDVQSLPVVDATDSAS